MKYFLQSRRDGLSLFFIFADAIDITENELDSLFIMAARTQQFLVLRLLCTYKTPSLILVRHIYNLYDIDLEQCVKMKRAASRIVQYR